MLIIHIPALRSRGLLTARGIVLLVSLLLLMWGPAAARARSFSLFAQATDGERGVAQSRQDVRALEMDAPIERKLAGGESHSYHLRLGAGQFTLVVIEQRGLDAVVTVLGPNHETINEVDRESNSGLERVLIFAEIAGTYRLDVRSLNRGAAAGRYAIWIEERQTATPQEKSRVAAENLFAHGEQLRRKGTIESRQQATRRYEEALSSWRKVGDRRGEADALTGLGLIFSSLGENRKAKDYYDQALALRREAGDRRGEAATLHNLGAVYHSLSDREKAMSCYNQALPLRRVVMDRAGEAETLAAIGQIHQSLDETEKALEHYGQALSIYWAIDNRGGLAATLIQTGTIYGNMGEYKKALEYFEQAHPLFRLEGDRQKEARALFNIGVIHHHLAELQKALDYYNRAYRSGWR